MAYTTGTATNASGVLDAIRLFAISIGWTIDRYASYSAGYELTIHNPNDTTPVYYNWYSDDSNGIIWGKPSTGYSSSLHWYNQTGSYYTAYSSNYAVRCNDLLGGPFVGHHLFSNADADYIHMVIEVSTGRYTHMGMGVMNKFGAYTGGQYMYGLYWYLNAINASGDWMSLNHRVPFDTGSNSTPNGFVRFDDGEGLTSGNTTSTGPWQYMDNGNPSSGLENILCHPRSSGGYYQQQIYTRSPAYFNSMAPLIFPLSFTKNSTGNVVCLGQPMGLAFVNMKYIEPATTIQYGGNDWMLFPLKQKGRQIAGDSTPFSLWFGHAYKVIT